MESDTEVLYKPYKLSSLQEGPYGYGNASLHEDKDGNLFRVDARLVAQPVPATFKDALKKFGPVSYFDFKPSGDVLLSYYPMPAAAPSPSPSGMPFDPPALDTSKIKSMIWSPENGLTDITPLAKRAALKQQVLAADVIRPHTLIEHLPDGSLWETDLAKHTRKKVFQSTEPLADRAASVQYEMIRETPSGFLLERQMGKSPTFGQTNGRNEVEIVNTTTGKSTLFKEIRSTALSPDGSKLLLLGVKENVQIDTKTLIAKPLASMPNTPALEAALPITNFQFIDSDRLVIHSPNDENAILYDFRETSARPLKEVFPELQRPTTSHWGTYSSYDKPTINPFLASQNSSARETILVDASKPGAPPTKIPGCDFFAGMSPNGRFALCESYSSFSRASVTTLHDLKNQTKVELDRGETYHFRKVQDDGSILDMAVGGSLSTVQRHSHIRSECVPLSRRIEPLPKKTANHVSCTTCIPGLPAAKVVTTVDPLRAEALKELCSKSYNQKEWENFVGKVPDSGNYSRDQAILLLKEMQKPGAWNTKRHLPVLFALRKSDLPITDPGLVTRGLLTLALEVPSRFEQLMNETPFLLKGEPDTSCETPAERLALANRLSEAIQIDPIHALLNRIKTLDALSSTLKPFLTHLRALENPDLRRAVREKLKLLSAVLRGPFSNSSVKNKLYSAIVNPYSSAWIDAQIPETPAPQAHMKEGAEKTDVHVVEGQVFVASTRPIAGYPLNSQRLAGLFAKQLEWTPSEDEPTHLVVWETGGKIYRKKIIGVRASPDQEWEIKIEEVKP